jgi:hypothetical protein
MKGGETNQLTRPQSLNRRINDGTKLQKNFEKKKFFWKKQKT